MASFFLQTLEDLAAIVADLATQTSKLTTIATDSTTQSSSLSTIATNSTTQSSSLSTIATNSTTQASNSTTIATNSATQTSTLSTIAADSTSQTSSLSTIATNSAITTQTPVVISSSSAAESTTFSIDYLLSCIVFGTANAANTATLHVSTPSISGYTNTGISVTLSATVNTFINSQDLSKIAGIIGSSSAVYKIVYSTNTTVTFKVFSRTNNR